MRLRPFLLPASFALATGACNAIFGIDDGTPAAGGAASSSGRASSAASASSAGGGGATSAHSAASVGAGTGGAASVGVGTGGAASSGAGGGTCASPGTATCTGAVLQVCDVGGHLAAPVTCDAVAACDAVGQRCNDFGALGRLGLGHARACAVEDDRSVKCWGGNSSDGPGDLVPGITLDQVRVPATVTGAVQARQVTVSGDHQCILQDDGTVTCWGDNGSGQLGFAPAGVQAPAGVPALTGVVEVRAADSCTCVRHGDDGTVACFGQEDYGCLGTAGTVSGSQPNPTPVGVTGAVALRMGYYTPYCALLASGGVTCWSDVLPPTPVPGVTGALEIAVTWNHVFIRDATGVSWSELNAAMTGWTTPVPYPETVPLAAMAGGDHFCGLRTDGVVTCTALYDDPPDQQVPLSMQPGGTVAEIASGAGAGYFTGLDCLRLDGPIASGVYCLGDDGGGALGVGEPDDVTTPASVTLTGTATQVSASEMSTTALLSDGSAVYWGYASGLSDLEVTTPSPLSLGTTNLVIHENDDDGSAYVLQEGSTPLYFGGGTPMPGSGLDVTGFTDFVDARPFFDWDIGLRAGGDVMIFAWDTDANDGGAIGNGMGAPTMMAATKVAGLAPVQALAAYEEEGNAAQSHVCVILQTTGAVACWGMNSAGEVGPGVAVGAVSYVPVPVPLPGNDTAVSIAAGYDDTCVAAASGKVYCWGDNGAGQIGQSSLGGNFPIATQVLGITAARGVSMLTSHACAWLSGGSVMCWGQNDLGQLGNGAFTIPAGPVAVIGVTTATQVSAGDVHSCAVLSGGGVTCWGSSYQGEVGTGQMGQYADPQGPLAL